MTDKANTKCPLAILWRGHKKLSVQVGSWYKGEGETMFYRQKITGVSAYNTQNSL